ncbi:MAG: 3-keto-disaccharide hydrolase [Longimicrobiales bacterium]
MIRSLRGFGRVALVGFLASCGGAGQSDAGAEGAAGAASPNVARASNVAGLDGWRMLVDGSLDQWRGYQQADVPQGWEVDGQVLSFTPGGTGGDLITNEQFEDFEFSLEWKLSARGNSGIFYRVMEEGRYAYWTGPEMQVLDNAEHRDGQNPLTSAGANYGLQAPTEDVTRPIGEWNEARVVVRGSDVEHWLNGTKVVAYTLGTEEWKAMVAETKFAEWPDYGTAALGHLGLQDHGDPVSFRNIRVRLLK